MLTIDDFALRAMPSELANQVILRKTLTVGVGHPVDAGVSSGVTI
jgi:hypothetical protein